MNKLFFYLFVSFIGFFAQIIDGTLGMGYGVSSSSFLIALGLYPAIVSASVHTAEVATSFVSGISHFKMGNIRRDIFLPLIIPGVIGAVLGAMGVVNLPSKIIKPLFSIVLLSMGFLILYKYIFKFKAKQAFRNYSYASWKVAGLGFFAAFIDALGGGGWGPICTPAFLVNDEEPRKAVGTVNAAEFFVTVAATITFIVLIGLEKFRWDLVLILMVFGVIAAPLAAFLCRKIPHRPLAIAIGILIVLLNLRTIILAFTPA